MKIFISLLLLAVQGHAALTAEQILKRADAIRAPAGAFKVSAQVVSFREGGREDVALYEVSIKGKDRTLIQTMAPPTERGTSTLMINRDLWVFLPDLSKPVRISLQQRLVGQVANGDLARMNFIGDYTPKIAEVGKSFYKLDLQAKTEDITYGRVELWVQKNTFRPLRAAFYAASGRLLKVGSYENYTMLAGEMRPGKLILTDAINKTSISTIHYTQIKKVPQMPDKLFTKDYLKKLKY